MVQYVALLTLLRLGIHIDQWNSILDQIRAEDSAYVLNGTPGYYLGPHLPVEFEGKVYDATHSFLVRDDGAGMMRIVD
jgi:hypothetical protein